MMTQEQNLSPEQKELVAVGASVGSGCQPCASHHLKAGSEAGLDGVQLLAAVTSAERVRAEAAVAVSDHVRDKLGQDVASPALLSRLEEAFASLGAAVGANDATNIERQLRSALELGASRPQLQQAIETAQTVQENATRIHVREAERVLDAVAEAKPHDEASAEAGCGCHADADTAEVPHGSETPEPVAATADDAGCSGMTDRFAAAGTPSAMTACREMFERFMGSATAPAKTEQAPAATAVTGPCRKEA